MAMYWIIAIITLIVIGMILLFSRVYISFSLEISGHGQILKVYGRLYGIRVFKREINFAELEDSANLKDLFSGKGFKEGLDKIQQTVQHFFALASDLQMATRIFLNHIYVHKVEWETCFGTGEASATGMAAGGIWTVKGYLIGLLDHLSQLKCTPVIDVTPHFQRKYLDSTLDCMVSIRIGQAIHALIKVIRKSSFRKKEALI